MRLLRDIMDQPLDPSYALAAARRRTPGARSRRTAVAVTVVIALVCGWAVADAVGELRRPEPGQAVGRATLERDISRRTAADDREQQTIQQLRDQIAAAQQAQLTSQGDTALAARIRQLTLITGEIPVTGPGLEITLSDAPSVTTQGSTTDPRLSASGDQGRVLDHDLQIVVNGLWAAGAEAVAINDRRLTTLAAIRAAGEAILVDFRPVLPPYHVRAIGDPSSMLAQFDTELAAQYLRSLRSDDGIGVSVTTSTGMRLPAAGSAQLTVAGVASAGPTTPPSPHSSPLSSTPTTTTTPTTPEVHP